MMQRFNGLLLVWLCAAALISVSAQSNEQSSEHSNVQAHEQSERQAVARSYAEVVGRLALTDKLFSAMSERCDTNVAMPSESYSAIDFALRMQTNMSFFQWRKQFSNREQEAKLVEQLMSSTLTDIGGCDDESVKQWYTGMLQNMLTPSITQLTELPNLLGISRNKPNDEQLARAFVRQLSRYETLSLAEVRGLAMALENGIYRYSMTAFTNQFAKDYSKAVTLREFIYDQTGIASDLYELADSLRFTDRERAVTLFGEAAEQGNFNAQRWYGNYQACIGNTEKALYWLDTAKQSDPDEVEFIDDIISEITELGEPTNCLDGWVY